MSRWDTLLISMCLRIQRILFLVERWKWLENKGRKIVNAMWLKDIFGFSVSMAI